VLEKSAPDRKNFAKISLGPNPTGTPDSIPGNFAPPEILIKKPFSCPIFRGAILKKIRSDLIKPHPTFPDFYFF
jgi:hypothetical protein